MGRATSFWHSRSSRRQASSAPATPRPEPDHPPVGCMSMVHYLIFTPGAGCVGRPPAGVGVGVSSSSSASGVVTPHNRLEPSDKSGFEAPRNSLDLDADGGPGGDFRIGVQIEPVFDALAARAVTTRGGCARRGGGKGKASTTAPSSEAATPRTPSLVARLMGIDGLPDDDDGLLLSPAPGTGKQHQQNHKKPTTSSGKKNAAFDNSNNKENASTAATTPAGTTTPTGSSKEKKKRVIPESMTRRNRDREPLRSLSCNAPAAGQQQSRSLPDTPRASTSASARASWDGPRLSLQALRDNVLDRAAQYMSMPSSPTSTSSAAAGTGKKKKDGGRRRRDDETSERAATAAKAHAREILRQAKETVASRKTWSNSNSKQSNSSSNKENVLMSPARVPDMEMEEDKLVVVVHGNGSSCRPMLAPPSAAKPQGNPQSCQRQSPSPVRVPLAPQQQQQQQAPPLPPPQRAKPSRPPPPPPPLDPPPTRARRRDGCERFTTRIKKPGAAGGGGPSSAPSSASPSPCAPPTATTAATAVLPMEEDPEYSYLRKVLERGGFMRPPPCRRPARAALLNLKQQQGGHWQQPATAWPVDPIVFHLLELELPAEEERALGPLRHRWNRKLLFHAAQEVLAGLLTVAPDAAAATTGPALLAKVWATVRGFPGADCRVVGDIDALVAADLEREPAPWWSARRHPAVAEAAAGAVADAVADRVLDALLAECVAESSWVGVTCGGEVAVGA